MTDSLNWSPALYVFEYTNSQRCRTNHLVDDYKVS